MTDPEFITWLKQRYTAESPRCPPNKREVKKADFEHRVLISPGEAQRLARLCLHPYRHMRIRLDVLIARLAEAEDRIATRIAARLLAR